jgi:aldose 1-epimerase
MRDASAQRYRVGQGTIGHGDRTVDVVTLSDLDAESMATMVPEYGFACIGFRVFSQGDPWNVLSERPDASSFLTRPTRYGIPILFPWPNRIREGRFTFDGREYQLPLAPGAPHASHGFVRQRPWTVQAAGTDGRGAFCRASVTIGDDAQDAWPFPCRLTLEYRLAGTTLSIETEAENLGTAPMPMGFGIHPWFDIPFGPTGTRAQTELKVPASSFWELDETTCTTGAISPIAVGFDARDWRPLEDRFLDDVLTGLQFQDGWFTAEVRDPSNGRALVVRADGAFREHVVFAPLYAEVVCLEPYTCTTDAFNLAVRGIDSGLVVLEPGQTWRGAIEITAHP